MRLRMAADPETQRRIQTNLQKVLDTVPPDQRAALQRQIVNSGAAQLDRFLNSQFSSPGSGRGQVPVSNDPDSILPTPARPESPSQQQQQLAKDIASKYSSLPTIRQQIEQDIATRVSGLPDEITLAVLQDWRADLAGERPDRIPQTGIDATVEERVLVQLQLARMTVQQLPLDVQRRLRAGQAQAAPPGGPL